MLSRGYRFPRRHALGSSVNRGNPSLRSLYNDLTCWGPYKGSNF